MVLSFIMVYIIFISSEISNKISLNKKVTPDEREVKSVIHSTGDSKKIIKEERDPKSNELVGE